MKMYFIALVMSCTFMGISAQSFQGIIHYQMSPVVTDPQKKKEMEESMKKAQEQMTPEKLDEMIKTIETQMESASMKKALADNPSLKATLDSQLQQLRAMRAKAAEGNGGSAQPGTIGIVMKIKGDNALTHMDGMMSVLTGDILVRGAEKKTYQIFPENKTYSEILPDKTATTELASWKTTPTSDYETIQGYRCRKYLTQNTKKPEQKAELWVTNEISMPKGVWQGNDANLSFMNNVSGFPMRIDIQMEEESTMRMEVVELKKISLPDSTFQIPSDYRKTN